MADSLLEKTFARAAMSSGEIENMRLFLRKEKRRLFLYRMQCIGLISLGVLALFPGYSWSLQRDEINVFYGSLAAITACSVALTWVWLSALRDGVMVDMDLKGLDYADLNSAMKESGIKELSADSIAYVGKVNKRDRPLIAFELKRILQSEIDKA